MNHVDPRPDPQRRTAHYEYAWRVERGTPFVLYPSIRAALDHRPPGVVDPQGKLLAQLVYDDDGSLAGQARAVNFRGGPS